MKFNCGKLKFYDATEDTKLIHLRFVWFCSKLLNSLTPNFQHNEIKFIPIWHGGGVTKIVHSVATLTSSEYDFKFSTFSNQQILEIVWIVWQCYLLQAIEDTFLSKDAHYVLYMCALGIYVTFNFFSTVYNQN